MGSHAGRVFQGETPQLSRLAGALRLRGELVDDGGVSFVLAAFLALTLAIGAAAGAEEIVGSAFAAYRRIGTLS